MPSASSAAQRKGLILALLASTQFVIVLDASIVNVALPSVMRDLDFTQESVTWVLNAYALVFGGFLLLGGRLADHLGRRRMFMTGAAIFGLASLAGGLAQSSAWLVIARGFQGFGGAIIGPAALSMVTTTFEEGAERNKALGVWGAVAGMGGAAGVLLGGILTQSLGWQAVLLVNVPVLSVIWVLAPRILPESRAETDEPRTFDVPGAVAITAGIGILIYALVNAPSAGWGSGQTLGLLALAAVTIGAFVAIEQRQSAPLVPLSIFKLGTLRGANVVGLLVGASLFSMFLFITFYLQNVLHHDALRTGLEYLPLALTIIVSAGVASALVSTLGFKPVLMTGMLLITAGLLWFSRVSVDGTWLKDILGPSLLAAAGLGFSFVPVTIAAVAGTKPHEAGLASGLINTSQQVGGALGVSVLIAVASGTLPTGAAPTPADLTSRYQHAFLAGAAIALAGALYATFAISSKDSRAFAEAARSGEAQTAVPVA
ncbi:MAG: MFS transporter [Solirubrobacteraceae bacterium]